MSAAEKPTSTSGSTTPPDGVSIIDAPTPDAQAAFLAETSAHSRQIRIGWEFVAGAVALVLLGAGVTYALTRTDGDAPPSQARPSAAQSSGAVVDSSGVSVASASEGVTTTAGVGGSPGTSAVASGAPNQVRTPPERPAAPGAPLPEVSAPPQKTIAMLVVPKGFTAATYGIVFEPYGWGPGGSAGGRVVIRITSSKPTNASASALAKDFAGRNASVWCSPEVASSLTKGGTYSGILQVRPQADVGTLYLLRAASVK